MKKKKKKETLNFTVRLPIELGKQLDETAEAENRTRHAQLINILEDFFEKKSPVAAKQTV